MQITEMIDDCDPDVQALSLPLIFGQTMRSLATRQWGAPRTAK